MENERLTQALERSEQAIRRIERAVESLRAATPPSGDNGKAEAIRAEVRGVVAELDSIIREAGV